MIRWTARNKAIVLHAIQEGHLSEADARKHYALSTEELTSWRIALESRGLRGLLNNPKSSVKGWHRVAA